MFGLCKYKNLFGEPNTGLRKYRIFDIAVMDVAVVIGFGYLISKYLNWNLGYTLGGLFILGVIAHRMFCVRTGLDKLLFPSDENSCPGDCTMISSDFGVLFPENNVLYLWPTVRLSHT